MDQILPTPLMIQTMFRVKGMCSLSQGTAARRTAKTLPVEVEPLCTDPFHHVNTLLTWVTLVTWWGECSSYRANLGRQQRWSDDEKQKQWRREHKVKNHNLDRGSVIKVNNKISICRAENTPYNIHSASQQLCRYYMQEEGLCEKLSTALFMIYHPNPGITCQCLISNCSFLSDSDLCEQAVPGLIFEWVWAPSFTTVYTLRLLCQHSTKHI